MSHYFLHSTKQGVSYCSFCGCLQYKNTPSKNLFSIDNNFNILNIDPLIVKYKPISLNLDISLIAHENYLKFRQRGLTKIYFLSNNFNLGKNIIFKAIGAMDEIYLNNENIPLENIEIISSVCVLLSVQFNDCCSKENKIKLARINQKNCNKNQNINDSFIYVNNAKCLNQYLIKNVKNLMYWETFCLKKLKYNLSKYTTFDYIKLFFSLGIIFTNESIDMNNIFCSSINILEIITNHYNICKYSQYVIAMSIIYIQFNNNKYFDKKIFKYIYGVNFDKEKYTTCINYINNVLKLVNFLNYKESFLLNNYEINNNELYNNINKLLNFVTNKKIIDYNNNKGKEIINNSCENHYVIQLLLNYFNMKLYNSVNNIRILNDKKISFLLLLLEIIIII